MGPLVVAPTVANDVVLTGTACLGPGVHAGPVGVGSLVALNKRTGGIVRETMLDQFFQGGNCCCASVCHVWNWVQWLLQRHL